MSDELKRQIEQSVEQATALLTALALFVEEETDESLDAVIEQSAQRQQSLNQLFNGYSQTQLSQHPELLNKLLELNQELITKGSDQKEVMAKKILKQKKSTKATNAYLQSSIK